MTIVCCNANAIPARVRIASVTLWCWRSGCTAGTYRSPARPRPELLTSQNEATADRCPLRASRLARLGLAHPRTRVIDDPAAAPGAAEGLAYPLLVKPNVGGSGAGIQSFASRDELLAAVPGLELGLDGTALVQEQLPAEGDQIVRIEILNGEFLYAIRILLMPGSFNLCPADYCELPGVADGVSGRGLPIEAYEPPAEVVDDAKQIVAAAGMDVAGVEYLVDARTGCPTFYDLNALSNFVADARNVLGFDPFENLVDLIAERAEMAQPVAA